MNEHDEHRQRVYRRFLSEGLSGFEEHNALEFLLFLAKARGDTNALAHALIARFGSLAGVLDASPEELQQVPGVGFTTAVALTFIPQMCGYYLNSKVNCSLPLDSVEAAAAFFMPKFFGKTQENFLAAAVDDRRRLLRCEEISDGLGNTTSVSAGKIVAMATRCSATGIFLAHNHPRGIVLPSSSDLAATRDIFRALGLVHVELLDHFIFSDNEYLSFAKTSYLATIKEECGR